MKYKYMVEQKKATEINATTDNTTLPFILYANSRMYDNPCN